jgi:hypothetical protein
MPNNEFDSARYLISRADIAVFHLVRGGSENPNYHAQQTFENDQIVLTHLKKGFSIEIPSSLRS